VPILSPRREGAWGNASTVGYVLASAACALAATALMYLLLLSTPYPRVFFGWIIGLATLVAVVFPFSTTAPTSQKIATGLLNLILGVAIGSLIGEGTGQAVAGLMDRLPPPWGAPSRSGRVKHRELSDAADAKGAPGLAPGPETG